MVKEYVSGAVPDDGVQVYLNERGKEGYVLVDIQPAGRRIKDTSQGAVETVVSYIVTMERESPE